MSNTNYDEIMNIHANMRTLNPLKVHDVKVTTKLNGSIFVEIIGKDRDQQDCITDNITLTKDSAIRLKNILTTLLVNK